jgi:hypothetical protein
MTKKVRNGFITTTNIFGEAYIQELTRELFHKVDSRTTYSKLFKNSFSEPHRFFVVSGTDSGLFLEYIGKIGIPSSTRIVFVELPEVIDWLKKNGKYPKLPQNIVLTELAFLEKQLNTLNVHSYILKDNLYYIASLSAQYGYYKPYADFSQGILDYIKSLHWNVRVELDKKDFIIGQLENAAENRIPSSVLYQKFIGKTAVLLAGGPSLTSLLPWLKEHREEVTVFAVSRVAAQLLVIDIQPDFFVTVHTQPISYSVSKEMLLFQQGSILISHAQACPRLVGQWQGKHVYMGHLLPWESHLNGPNKDLVGPTVSHAAYDIIVKMGFKTVILGGVDLCFSKQNTTHSTDDPNSASVSRVEGGDVRTLTNTGEVAETTFAFQRGIEEFGKMALRAREDGCITINPSSLSAKIEGVAYVPLDELSPSAGHSRLKGVAELLESDEDQATAHFQMVQKELTIASEKIRQIRSLALQGFQTVAGDADTQQDPEEILNRCKELVSTISSKKHQWMFEALRAFESYFFNVLSPPAENETEGHEEKLNNFKLFFTAVIVSADRLNAHITKAIDRIDSRIEEFRSVPDMKTLFRQWHIDGQPGRALIFSALHKDNLQQISNEDLQVLEQLTNRFYEECRKKPTPNGISENVQTWNIVRLDKLRNRIFDAFNDKNRELLSHIILSLSEDTSTKITSHLRLAGGLLSELNNDTEEALSSYNAVIDGGEQSNAKILEDCLSRIASISISSNDLENARLALQCLSDISIANAPTYAEFLYISGKTEEALEVYADYLGKVPDDLETMLKLGRIYKDLDSREGVKMVTEYVLERDPGNQTAVSLKEFLRR